MFQGKSQPNKSNTSRFRNFWIISVTSAICNVAIAMDAVQDAAHFVSAPSTLYASASAFHMPDGTDINVIEAHQTYRFDAEGNSVFTEYMVYKILSPAGAEGWNDVSVNWSPWRNQMPTMKARVISADGKSYTLDPATIADSPAYETDSTMYSDERTLRAPLPAIAVGAVVETEITLKETLSFPGAGKLGRSFFQMSQPVQHFRLTLQAPKAKHLFYRLDSLPNMKPLHSEQDTVDEWVFESGPTPAYDDAEHGVPSDISAYPVVTFGLGTSWQELAQAYAKIVNTKIEQSNLESLVERLIRDKSTREEKISAIVTYLNKEIRYTGIEFNQASIFPHSPTETLSRKFGDCKDKSTLLVAMLKTAGISANLALLNVADQLDVVTELPGMGLFDHAIVYVPGAPAIWIDATDADARVGQLPDADHGRMALVVDANTTSLTKVVTARSEENLLVEEREIYLSENGPARIVEISKPEGNYEPDYRHAYADLSNKKTKEGLTDYFKNQYQAEKLDRLQRSDPKDFQQPFSLTLESKQAKRGYTSLDEANAYIQLDNLFLGLPDDLKTREPTDEENAKGTRPHKKREYDYQLLRPFITEWHYKIVPPIGFVPAALPSDVNISVGPSKLQEQFSVDSDGNVRALLRFNTVKDRYTVAEQTELRAKVAELIDSPLIKIKFNLKAQVLLTQGKADESFKVYRELIALYPKSAINHLRRANALLRAGMGEAARAEAQIAVKLDPKSAFAQTTLAEILQYDLIGRWHQPGADFKGAAAAYRIAISLDPNDKTLVANYAILLEYDDSGIRYSEKADLRAAVTAYKTLTASQLAEMKLPNNLAYILFYTHDFSGAKANAEALNAPPVGLIAACDAQLNGIPSALADARRRSSSDANYKEIVTTAGKMLMNLREYSHAADLLEAGASGTNMAATMGLAATLRKATRNEDMHFENRPDDFIKSLLVTAMRADYSIEKLQAFESQNALSISKDFTDEERAEELKGPRKILITALRSVIPPNVLIDISLPSIQIKSFGDDLTGYRETVEIPSQPKQTFFVIKETGKYKLLGMSSSPTPIALEVLDRIKRQDLNGARLLLNWLRDAIPSESNDDKYAGNLFPRFWIQERENVDANRMAVATASLLVQKKNTAERGIAILEQAKTAGVTDADNENIDLALMVGYLQLKNYDRANIAVKALEQRTPHSRRVFFTQVDILRGQKKFEEADKLVQNKLNKDPDDIDALRSLSTNYAMQRRFEEAYELEVKASANGNSAPSDFNQLAWLSLFFSRQNGPDIESALRASQLVTNSMPILHTLGCIYAEMGKTKEARDLMLQIMDLQSLDQPNSYLWYVFGRIAEQYGERDIALADYAKVSSPKGFFVDEASTFRLAQNRMQILEQHK
jgi:predicted Zn-dependent protease/transglutaminase-like putative cysteine protease